MPDPLDALAEQIVRDAIEHDVSCKCLPSHSIEVCGEGLTALIVIALRTLAQATEARVWKAIIDMIEDDARLEVDWSVGTEENLARLRERLMKECRRRATGGSQDG